MKPAHLAKIAKRLDLVEPYFSDTLTVAAMLSRVADHQLRQYGDPVPKPGEIRTAAFLLVKLLREDLPEMLQALRASSK